MVTRINNRWLRLGERAVRIYRRHGLAQLLRRAPQKVKKILLQRRENARLDRLYQRWIGENEPPAELLERQKTDSTHFAWQPLISIITPTYETPLPLLDAMIGSVLAQTYRNWELCLADGNSTAPGVKAALQQWAARDPRIKVIFLNENKGISGNSNEALALAQGEFIALLDHDDLLAPFALFEVGKLLNERPACEFIYSDRDLLSADGSRRFLPWFKPDWSPEFLLSANYLCHFTVVRRSLIEKKGVFDPAFDGAQDWDWFLRLTETTEQIAHIPQILYHWRHWSRSASVSIEAKPYAKAAQLGAIRAHLRRRGLAAETRFDASGYIHADWPLSGRTKVSILIPTRGPNRGLRRCLSALAQRTSYANYEVLLLHCGQVGEAEQAAYRRLTQAERIRVLAYEQPFDWPAVNNWAAPQAAGEVLLFLDENTQIHRPDGTDWLTELVRWAELPEIGAVEAQLFLPNGLVQHAEMAPELREMTGQPCVRTLKHQITAYDSTLAYRNCLAVTGACLMLRRALFEEAGGFDERYSRAVSASDLCLRLGQQGYRVVNTPYARLTIYGALQSGRNSSVALL